MFKRMLVVVRGMGIEQPAVQRAELCATRATQLSLFDVVHEPLLEGYMGNTAIYESLRARVVAERSEHVKELAAALERHRIEATGAAVWDHPLDEAISKRAQSELADVVVFAPVDKSGGLSHSDWRVVAACPAPVLVVKGEPQRKYEHIVAAVDPFHAHAKPAQLDVAILAQAAAMQARTGARLSVVHCFAPSAYSGADLTKFASHGPNADERKEALDTLLRKAGISAVVRIEPGAPHDVLKQMAERGEADLIVMGVLTRGRLKDWLIGSTAERVLHSVRADVLVVKPAHTR